MIYKFTTFILVLFLLVSSKTYATHLSGAEFSFEHVSGNDYIVSLTLYRDCNGISASTYETIQLSSANCGVNTTIGLPRTSGPIVVTTIPAGQTTCVGGSIQGYEEYIYSDTITFSAQCTDWLFSWASCCRNAAITNLQSPSGTSMYIESSFDNTVVNNSPTYFVDPIFYGSMGANFSVALGGSDPDGDQLVFNLAAPAGSAATPLPFATGLSVTQPLDIAAGTAVSFSSTTGQFNCVLNAGAQIVVFDVIVEEWRSGQKIGEHRRSLQILPINLGGHMLPPPAINNPSGGTIIDAHTMEYNSPTQPFSFSMLFTDQDATDVITYNSVYSSLETAFPNAQITSSNPNGTQNELQLNITLPTPSSTIFSIVIEENNFLQQSFSYELRSATSTNLNAVENAPISVNVYPNPVEKITTFSVDAAEVYEQLELHVFDVTGKLIHTQKRQDTQELQFDRTNFSAGLYSFQLQGDNQVIHTGLLQLK